MRLSRIAFPLLLLAGCKQPVGGRCQIDTDCESGLVCSTAEPKTCRVPGSESFPDAAVSIDAAVSDAAVDAAEEADAGPDAGDLDAAEADAF